MINNYHDLKWTCFCTSPKGCLNPKGALLVMALYWLMEKNDGKNKYGFCPQVVYCCGRNILSGGRILSSESLTAVFLLPD